MSLGAIDIRVGFDTTSILEELADTNKEVDDAKKNAKLVIRSIQAGVRKAVQLSILAVEAVAGSLDAVTRYAIEGLLSIAEGIFTVASAEALSGVLIFRAGVHFAAATAIMIQINNMIHQRAETAQQMGRVAIFLRSAATMSF